MKVIIQFYTDHLNIWLLVIVRMIVHYNQSARHKQSVRYEQSVRYKQSVRYDCMSSITNSPL